MGACISNCYGNSQLDDSRTHSSEIKIIDYEHRHDKETVRIWNCQSYEHPVVPERCWECGEEIRERITTDLIANHKKHRETPPCKNCGEGEHESDLGNGRFAATPYCFKNKDTPNPTTFTLGCPLCELEQEVRADERPRILNSVGRIAVRQTKKEAYAKGQSDLIETIARKLKEINNGDSEIPFADFLGWFQDNYKRISECAGANEVAGQAIARTGADDRTPAPEKSMALAYCPVCIQMTNHSGMRCLKCKKIHRKCTLPLSGGKYLDKNAWKRPDLSGGKILDKRRPRRFCCLHRTDAHDENGCKSLLCPCKRPRGKNLIAVKRTGDD